MSEKLASWYADMHRKGLNDSGRYIKIEVPKDLDNVELEFLDEYWSIVRNTIQRFSHKRMKRDAVPADFGLPNDFMLKETP